MALWRLIWVNETHTQELGRIMSDFPEGPSNNISNFTIARYGNADSLCAALMARGEITRCSPSSFNFLRDPATLWDVFPDGGFTNGINNNDLYVGQRFYIDRWDANHPYIEVTSRNGAITQFQYKCYDGTVYATVNLNFVNYVSAYTMGCLPWCLDTNSDAWTNNNQAKLVQFPLTYYVTGSPSGFGTSFDTISADYQIGKKFWGNVKPLDGDNPYLDGGTSTTGGGNPQKQNWSEESDVVKPSALPSETDYGATACGLITIFHPTKSQLRRLAEVIWGQGFFNFLQNLVENISELFISLAMVPFELTHGSTVEVTWFSYDVGGEVPIGTGIYLDLAPAQWVEFDMGTIALTGTDDRIFAMDSVLDYSPYSKLGIYLPFIGYQELDIDECRNSSMNLLYRIDLLSGTVLALITMIVDGKERTIYQFTGNCLTQIPLTNMDASSLISNAVNIGIAAMSAGATGAIASAGDALTAERLSNGDISKATAELQNAQHAAQVSNANGGLISSTANGVMGMKPNFKKTGAISGASTLFGVMQPYLFLTTPRQSVPDRYQHFCGLPCNITGKLGDFSGYTVVEDVRLNGLVATSPEVEEIYQLLKSGIII